MGKDVERQVLSRAVQAHLSTARTYDNRTVVFNAGISLNRQNFHGQKYHLGELTCRR